MRKLPPAKLGEDDIYPWAHYLTGHILDGPENLIVHTHRRYYQELLYYDHDGQLAGILIYSPNESPVNDAGEFTVTVDPAKQGHNIGARLLADALKRWDIDLYKQEYTKAGRRLAKSLLNSQP